MPAAHATFPLLADPRGYVACPWTLATDEKKRTYWLELCREHFPSLLAEAVREAVERGEDADDARRRADAARQDFLSYLDTVAVDPDRFGRLDLMQIFLARERALRRAGIDDPYRLMKRRYNCCPMY